MNSLVFQNEFKDFKEIKIEKQKTKKKKKIMTK